MKIFSLVDSPLGQFIKENMPKLHSELIALPTIDACRERLNRETGLQIASSETLESSCARYLEALICIKVIMEGPQNQPGQSRGLAQWLDNPKDVDKHEATKPV